MTSPEIRFDPGAQTVLGLLLAFIMFGVALGLTPSDLIRPFRRPRPVAAGLVSQFVLMPALTFVLLWLWQPGSGLALGLLLVAACPGGNISNFISALARADVGLSVSLTALSTVLCLLLTPLNLSLWAGLLPDTQGVLRSIALSPIDLFKTMLVLLILPTALGMTVRHRWPAIASRLERPMRGLSLAVFAGFVAYAVVDNADSFHAHWDKVLLLVMAHNALALLMGYGWGRLLRLGEAQCRSVSIETGIQNAGLGLVLCFTFFPGMGEMALVCAWWGVWHILSGTALGLAWSRVPPANKPPR